MSKKEPNGIPYKFDLEFAIPTDTVVGIARATLEKSSEASQDARDVAAALLDVTNRARRLQEVFEKGDGNMKLEDYIDNWIGDSEEAARRLLTSEDARERHMAHCLISQAEGMAKSRKSILSEIKRLKDLGAM